MTPTIFSQPPHWEWLIILYFFFGGIASGAYVIALAADFVGTTEDREVARIGYLLAFPLIVVAAILLIFDLGQPVRFWHMLIASKTNGIAFKYWSPMSIGSWALVFFGIFTFISFLGALAELGALPGFKWAREIMRKRPGSAVFGVVGGILAFFVGGYTGVLLSASNQPLWADSQVLGALFLVSAASTALALMLLLAAQRHYGHALVRIMEEADNWILGLELVALILFLATLGSLAGPFLLSQWGIWLIVGVGVVGILAPMGIHWRGPAALTATTSAAILALVGGFILRFAVVMGGQSL